MSPGPTSLFTYFMPCRRATRDSHHSNCNYYYAISREPEVEICDEVQLTAETVKQQYWHYKARLDDEQDYIDIERIKISIA